MKTIIIDSGSVWSWLYFARSPSVDEFGEPDNLLCGWRDWLTEMHQHYSPDRIVVALDGYPSWRKKHLPEYKSNRPARDPQYVEQAAKLKEACRAEGGSVIAGEQHELEADDIIANYVVTKNRDEQVIIVSGDKDLLQLVRENVGVYQPIKDRLVRNHSDVREITGVHPRLIASMLAITGDSADCIPGIEGWGKKNTTRLLEQFESERSHTELCAEARKIGIKEALCEKLEQQKSEYELFLKLTKLC